MAEPVLDPTSVLALEQDLLEHSVNQVESSPEISLNVTDRNECLDPLSCDQLTNCTNEYGSYSCSACPPNYTGTGKTGSEKIMGD